MRIKIMVLLLLWMVWLKGVDVQAASFVNFDEAATYSAETITKISRELVNAYPELLEIETIGYSTDGKPIQVIRMTWKNDVEEETNKVLKMDLLVEAGLHARETFNPVLVLKIIEDYAASIYEGDDVALKEWLQVSVIHFIPLMNPDGFNLVQLGEGGITDETLKSNLSSFHKTASFNMLKGNVNGVDLNRNFPDVYYDVFEERWVTRWGQVWTPYESSQPALAYYKGPYAGSEIETHVLMRYIKRYDFRAYLSYHSMGRVVYYYSDYLGSEHLKSSTQYAELVKKSTGYPLARTGYEGYGYSSYYFKNETMKPAILVETMGTRIYPAPSRFYAPEYYGRRLYELPLAFVEKMHEVGYYDYKLYVDGMYQRDFPSEAYAHAMALRDEGMVIKYPGKPVRQLDEVVAMYLSVSGEEFWMPFGVKTVSGERYIGLREYFEKRGQQVTWDATAKKILVFGGPEKLSMDPFNDAYEMVLFDRKWFIKMDALEFVVDEEITLKLESFIDFLYFETVHK